MSKQELAILTWPRALPIRKLHAQPNGGAEVKFR